MRQKAPPLPVAGLLLAAAHHLRHLDLPHPTGAQILGCTGAGRAQAYEYERAILNLLPDLPRPAGRPVSTADPAPLSNAVITAEVLRFVMEHPGCVHAGHRRQRYSDGFRHFVVELRDRHPRVDLPAFAQAAQIPLGTLGDWLRHGVQEEQPRAFTEVDVEHPETPRIETILDAWERWDGDLSDFRDHVNRDLAIPYGRTLISGILEQHGVRSPERRAGRSPDELALRGSFETFFAGAQSVDDGKKVGFSLNGETFDFNFELMVDAFSAALVGASVRDEEDSDALIQTTRDAAATVGAPPLAKLLDNRPSNHTPEVTSALDGTMVVRATVGRPQNKAHVEGAFGLFAQMTPRLEINASSPRELAQQVLTLIIQTWARTLNHRPRRDRGGRSRIELYQGDPPDAGQVAEAKAALAERCRRQELAHQTRTSRLDPIKNAVLDDAFARLELADPRGNLRSAIARYPIDAVLAGIATFDAKRTRGTLPPGVDGRYLLGIVRNVAQQDEGLEIMEGLLRARIDARNSFLVSLEAERDSVVAAPDQSASARLNTMIDRATKSERYLECSFWIEAAGAAIRQAPIGQRDALLRSAARRIHSTYRLAYRERLKYGRFLLSKVLPLDRWPE